MGKFWVSESGDIKRLVFNFLEFIFFILDCFNVLSDEDVLLCLRFFFLIL